MAYEVGVSSGFWQIARDPALLGLAQKAGFIATAGVTFNQIDLESMAEFLEPKVKENVRRIQKELGLRIGMHAEIGHLTALESAERKIWDEAHRRLVLSVKNAAEMNIVYINFHTSSTGLLQFNEARIRPFGFQYQVVNPEGKPFWELAEKSSGAKEYIKKIIMHGHMAREIANEEHFKQKYRKIWEEYEADRKKRVEDYLYRLKATPEYRSARPDEQRIMEVHEIERAENDSRALYDRKKSILDSNPDEFYDSLKKCKYAQYIMEAGEIDAYMTVAWDMYKSGDMLWTNIVGSDSPEDAYIKKEHEFNAAVAAKYIYGHLTVKDNRYNKEVLGGMSVLEFVNKKGLVICFELPEVEQSGETAEGMYRLFDPKHTYWLIKKVNSPYVRLCIDFEHMLSQHLDPYIEIPKWPSDLGSMVYLFHLGEPKPYWGKAHIPIPLGSQAQEVIYEWLYMMRKKGFKSGVLIFERGGGRSGGKSTFEVFEHSVIALKHMARYLDQDIKPDELPLDFYGISEKNQAVYSREWVQIRDHAADPLQGVLNVPEEAHTFLSKAAVERGKGQEWEKRKLR